MHEDYAIFTACTCIHTMSSAGRGSAVWLEAYICHKTTAPVEMHSRERHSGPVHSQFSQKGLHHLPVCSSTHSTMSLSTCGDLMLPPFAPTQLMNATAIYGTP